jgi:hypothetical protein
MEADNAGSQSRLLQSREGNAGHRESRVAPDIEVSFRPRSGVPDEMPNWKKLSRTAMQSLKRNPPARPKHPKYPFIRDPCWRSASANRPRRPDRSRLRVAGYNSPPLYERSRRKWSNRLPRKRLCSPFLGKQAVARLLSGQPVLHARGARSVAPDTRSHKRAMAR